MICYHKQQILGLEIIGLLVSTPFLLFPSLSLVGSLSAMVLLVTLWLGYWKVNGRPLPVTPLNVALLLWASAIAVSIAVTDDPDLTIPKATGLILGVATWRCLVVTIDTPRQWLIGWRAYGLLGAGMIALSIISTDWTFEVDFIEQWLSYLPPTMIHLPESAAAGVHMNQFAGVLVIYLPLVLMLFLGKPKHSSRWWALLSGVIFGALIWLLLLSQSRSGWLGGFVGIAGSVVVWAFFWLYQRRWLILLLLLMVLFVVGAIGWVGPNRIQQVWQTLPNETAVGSFSTLIFRQEVWRWSVVAIQEAPVTGFGLGSFRRIVFRRYTTNLDPMYDISHAHNIFLQVALDVGLPGLIAYLAMLFIVGWRGWERAKRDERLRPFILGIMIGLVALHIYGLLDALAPGSKPTLLFWMALGLLSTIPPSNDVSKSLLTPHKPDVA